VETTVSISIKCVTGFTTVMIIQMKQAVVIM